MRVKMICTPTALGDNRAPIARMIARKVAIYQLSSTYYALRARNNAPVIAASVGAAAKGTATSCVQLARLSPVTTYRTMKRPMLVPLKMARCQTIATAIQAITYAELIDRCHDLLISSKRLMTAVMILHDPSGFPASHSLKM